MSKLNLGCGNKKLANYVNVDNRAECTPDIVHDLNIFPYPFPDNHFSEIILDHVIEHLQDPLLVLQEIYRISAPDAEIFINCPHFSGNWVHPGHKSAISIHLFDFLKEDGEEVYGKTNFQVKKITLCWFRYSKGKRAYLILRFFNYLINLLANISPRITERFWCYYVGGFEEIRFIVKVIK
ncbi:MAG: methyltransferase domain-containing protein [Patescibacteria group bacterium]|jgi:SAM-dependent methyltransferase